MRQTKDLLLFLSFFLFACSTTVVNDESSPDLQYKEGQRLLKNGRYLEAIDRFRVLKSRHPYSPLAPLAALHIGEAYFEQSTYPEAIAAYRIFLHLHPSHEKASYALFRMGKSYYKMTPGSIDRDLLEAKKAIRIFEKLKSTYPKATYVKEAQTLIQKLNKKLMEKEIYVGDFYFHKKRFSAAATRYRQAVEKYNFPKMEEKALYLLSLSYWNMGKKNRAEKILNNLKNKYKNSKYIGKLEPLFQKT